MSGCQVIVIMRPIWFIAVVVLAVLVITAPFSAVRDLVIALTPI